MGLFIQHFSHSSGAVHSNCLKQSPFKHDLIQLWKTYLLQVTQYCLDSERPISKVSGSSLSHQGCTFIDADYKAATNLVDRIEEYQNKLLSTQVSYGL